MDSLFVLETITKYNQHTLIMGLFIAAMLYMIVNEDKKISKAIVWYMLFLVVTVFNEVFAQIFIKIFNGDDEYYRFIWTVPIVAITAYVGAKIVIKYNKRAVQIVMMLMLLSIIGVSGTNIGTAEGLEQDNIVEKVSDETIMISKIIHQDCECENPMVMLSMGRFLEMRQYDASIRQPFSREKYRKYMEYEQLPAKKKQKYAYMLRLITNGGFVENEENTKLLQKGIKKYDIEYLVINKSDDYSMIIENVGGKLVGETQVYMIYRFEKE